MKRTKSHTGILLFLGCGLLGGLFFVSLFGLNHIDPANTDWVLFGGGDNFQHYIGWRFFRNQPWTRFILFMRNLNYPVGTSVIVTDSNPLFSLIFKLFRNILPVDFQFNGIWLLLCYFLIGGFGASIGWKLTHTRFYAIVVSIFCILNPVILQRAAIHDTLAAHWLILAAITIALNWQSKWSALYWGLLFGLTLLIHAYFLPMIGLILLLQTIWMIYHQLHWKRIVIPWVICIGVVIAGYFLLGYQFIQPETGSFGELSMNLNAFINPDGTSSILSGRPTFPLQYEGFNYWGLGLLLFTLAGFIISFQHPDKRFLMLGVPCLFYLFFALSNTITWDQNVLAVIPLPGWLLDKLSVFRSSGRLGWVFYYFAVVFSAVMVRQYLTFHPERKKIVGGIVFVFLAIQFLDLSDFRSEYRSRFDHIDQRDSQIVSLDQWDEILDGVDHIAATNGESQAIDEFALLAANNSLTFNRSANARGIEPVFGGDMTSIVEIIQAQELQDHTLYVLLDDSIFAIAAERFPDKIVRLDGFNLLVNK